MPKINESEEEKEIKSKNIGVKGKATKSKNSSIVKNIKNVKKTTTNITTKKNLIKKQNKKETNVKLEKSVAMVSAKNTKPMVKPQEFLQEYYDLPYRYNETIVTILAQTPKRLFVYWDVSDKDKEAYKKAFGDDFFEKTYPVLLVHNEELNYTFEVPINDFANSWYLDIQDPKTNYVVQLGRKFRDLNQIQKINYEVIKEENINLKNDFIYITDSNKLESPNDHILFELMTNNVKYRNVKNGEEYNKNLKELLNDMNGIYPAEAVHKLYTKLYEDEIAKENFGRKNPGSEEFGLPTSPGTFGITR